MKNIAGKLAVMRMKADIRLRQKCLEKGLRCGYGARES